MAEQKTNSNRTVVGWLTITAGAEIIVCAVHFDVAGLSFGGIVLIIKGILLILND